MVTVMVTGTLMDEFSSLGAYSDPRSYPPERAPLSGATPSLTRQKQVLHPETTLFAVCEAGRAEEAFLGMSGDQPQRPRELESGTCNDLSSDRKHALPLAPTSGGVLGGRFQEPSHQACLLAR